MEESVIINIKLCLDAEYEHIVIQNIYIGIICPSNLICCFIKENNLVGGK